MTPGLSVSDVVLLILTFACWLMALVHLFFVVGRDAHGDAVVGQAIAFFSAMAFVGLTWLWLGGLLLKASSRGLMPAGVSIGMLCVYLASAAGAGAAFYQIQDPRQSWPALLFVLIPPILAGYVVALHRPSSGVPFAESLSPGVGVVVLLLSLAPWPSVFSTLAEKSEARAEHERAQQEWEAQEKIRARAENLVKLEAMSKDEPVMNWYGLLEEEGGVRAEAFEKLRHVARRQADIEDMLSWGVPKAIMLLPDLDLAPRSELCAATVAFLKKQAQSNHRPPTDEPAAYTSEGYVAESLPAIRWLRSRGCSCNEGVAALEAMVRTYRDSPQRQTVLASLGELRPAP